MAALFVTVIVVIGLSLCTAGHGIRCDLFLSDDSESNTAGNERIHPYDQLPAVVAVEGNKLRYQGLETAPAIHPHGNKSIHVDDKINVDVYPLDKRKVDYENMDKYVEVLKRKDQKEVDNAFQAGNKIHYNFQDSVDKNQILDSSKLLHKDEVIETPNEPGKYFLRNSSILDNMKDQKELTTKPDVLVLGYAKTSSINAALEYMRLSYKYESIHNPMPSLSHKGRGKFSVVIFEKFENYLRLKLSERDTLHAYCRTYNVGILAFTHPERKLRHARADGYPLFINSKLRLRDMEVNANCGILNITKAGSTLYNVTGKDDYKIFDYETVIRV